MNEERMRGVDWLVMVAVGTALLAAGWFL
jgi:hypothetical protein